jgi:hypothetical protein
MAVSFEMVTGVLLCALPIVHNYAIVVFFTITCTPSSRPRSSDSQSAMLPPAFMPSPPTSLPASLLSSLDRPRDRSLVGAGCHGHHGQLPAGEYLVATAAHVRDPLGSGRPKFLGWADFLDMCLEQVCIHVGLLAGWLAGWPAACARIGYVHVVGWVRVRVRGAFLCSSSSVPGGCVHRERSRARNPRTACCE